MEWLAVLVPVLVALIGGPIMLMMRRFDRRNSEQHGRSMEVLSTIKEAVLENRDDIREVKRDVQDLKADHRHLAAEHNSLVARLNTHLEDER